jgi:hypothetical protein
VCRQMGLHIRAACVAPIPWNSETSLQQAKQTAGHVVGCTFAR